jgi:putative Mg2+ transporter-C (MgtC) family protein
MNNLFWQAGETFLKLLVSVLAGALIGLNRSLHHRPAGIGTHALVAMGATLATILAIKMPGSDAQALSRVIQGLVTGVGFIGAGVIMREGTSYEVHGLTTAASVWSSAILGIAFGAADFVIGAIGIFFALAVLVASKPCEKLAGRIFGSRIDQTPNTVEHTDSR